MFLIFSTQQEAELANQQIIDNIRHYLAQYLPDRVHPDGLVAIDLEGHPMTNAAITTDWGIPQEYQEGWAIAKPEQKDVGRVPIASVLAGVGGTELAAVTTIAIDSLPA